MMLYVLAIGVAITAQYATPDRATNAQQRRVIDESQAIVRSGAYWPKAVLRSEDTASAKIRVTVADRFRTSKDRADAEVIAAPFLKGPFSTKESAYKAALSLYYLRLFGGRSYNDEVARRVWPAYVKLGDPASPEHARVAVEFAEATNFGRVRYTTAAAVLKKYEGRSDAIWIAFRVSFSASAENNVPGLISVADWARERRRTLPPGGVQDGYGGGALPKVMLLSLESHALNVAARRSDDRKLGRRAIAGFDELLKHPTTPPAVRELAKIVREGLLERRFMR